MEAINSVGKIRCRQLTFYPHIFEYPQDVMVPLCFVKNPRSVDRFLANNVNKLLDEADLIHIWNDEKSAFKEVEVKSNGLIKFPMEKARSYTWSGSRYRLNHVLINKRLRKLGARVVVQNPTYIFPEEIEAEFIPHAVDLKKFKVKEKWDEHNIGCYEPVHGITTGREDIKVLEKILKRKFPGWKTFVKETMCWEKRIKELAKCSLYFEYMDSKLGYWGRSALEACALGIPTMSYISNKALDMGGEKVGNPAIIHIISEILEKRLAELVESESYRREVGLKSRQWVEKYFSYRVVGEYYTKFFEEL